MKDSYTRRSTSAAAYLQLKDADNCTDIVVPCDANAVCLNKRQTDGCVCNPGFTGDGVTCSEHNECNTPDICHVNANCTNTYGSYTCRCNDRYEGDGVNCTPLTIKGEPCTQASDCIRDNFICSSGLCDCDVGYSYNSTSNTCVIRCDIYGTEFSHQSTTYCVTGYNNAVYSVNTYSACRNYCLAVTSFTCRTFELWNGACYLSEVVKTEVADSKWAAWSGCMYYQRHCA
ncbi:pro-epidermal growth factor-like [Haliotis rubra]|uniref:pro-epidermal growth factor-like n=1 Tax=Haliotis rubra TaxID=36100 RepID=UPI001EE504C5|nr:pro-epidermal growth factor-like [Haliotis rubra]